MHHKIVDSQELSILTTNSSLEEALRPFDRFKAIQEKLDRYSRVRTTNKELEAQDKISYKLEQIEQRLAEETQAMQDKILLWKEMLSEMRVQAQQQQKRCTLSLKQRRDEIRQLKQAIDLSTQQHLKQEQKSQQIIAQKFNKHFRALGESLEKQCNSSMAQINAMEYKFQQQLPNLHERIVTSSQYMHSVSSRLRRQVIEQSQELLQLLKDHSAQQEKDSHATMQLIACTIEEIEGDLEQERRQRRKMKQKLQFLVSSALARMGLTDK